MPGAQGTTVVPVSPHRRSARFVWAACLWLASAGAAPGLPRLSLCLAVGVYYRPRVFSSLTARTLPDPSARYLPLAVLCLTVGAALCAALPTSAATLLVSCFVR